MNSVIYKYPFGDNVTIQVPWPARSRVVHVAAQYSADATPTLWIWHVRAPRPDDDSRFFDLIGTGHPFTDQPGYEHVGSAVCRTGRSVWHVFGEAKQ